MATQLEKFDSTGGFSIDKTTVVDELRNGKDFNSFNACSHFSDDQWLYMIAKPYSLN